MKRAIPAIIAIVLIIIIGAGYLGTQALDKFSYSSERADLNDYFGITQDDQVAVVLQDELIDICAKRWDGSYYFSLEDVFEIFNDRFYWDQTEGLLLYTEPGRTTTVVIGDSTYSTSEGGNTNVGYVIAKTSGDTLYVALDYVKKFTNFSYEAFEEPNRLQIYTEYGERNMATLKKKTSVRVLGGIKSDILEDLQKGDKVIVLEQMETWSKVKTQDSIIGYVENKRLGETKPEELIPVSDYVAPAYEMPTRAQKVSLGWHVVAGVAGNDTLTGFVSQTKNMNVISPTWFALKDNEGNISDFSTADYVSKAHGMGLEVWGLVDNFSNVDVDTNAVLSSTTTRKILIDNLVGRAMEIGLDGINVDFENLSSETGDDFVQFIRELSIPCHEYGLILSVDNYVPMGYTAHYGREEQGVYADYVVIMGYDEHYAGSSEAGSVASIDYVENGISDTVSVVPSEKVINGIPFYTRIWKTQGGEVSSQALGMKETAEYIANHSIETRWDETTCQNYGEQMAGDGLIQVWIEDAESIATKLNVMRNYNLAGVAAWRIGFETPDVWDVIGAYVNE